MAGLDLAVFNYTYFDVTDPRVHDFVVMRLALLYRKNEDDGDRLLDLRDRVIVRVESEER